MSHIKRVLDCGKENRRKKSDVQKNDKENAATIVDGDFSIVYAISLVNLSCHTSDWVIDSGASFYVTAHRDYFTSYVNSDYGHIRMRNKGASKIVGIRDICFETSIGCELLVKDVKHAQNIYLNLISTGKLDDDGYTNQFSEGK